MSKQQMQWLRSDIQEIKKDVKLLLAERNRRIGMFITIAFVVSSMVTIIGWVVR